MICQYKIAGFDDTAVHGRPCMAPVAECAMRSWRSIKAHSSSGLLFRQFGSATFEKSTHKGVALQVGQP